MFVAGVSVPDKLVLELASLLRDFDATDTAETLEQAYDRQSKIVALTIQERETILRVLDDPPEHQLCELRDVLLQEHEWRNREGLS